MDANPLRYVYLKTLYPGGVSVAPNETVDSRPMNVLVAPNNLGAAKLYFDAQTHLLCRVEETGEVSAYYKNIAEFIDYKKVENVLFPFRIVHSSTAPGGAKTEFRISHVTENVKLEPGIFDRPQAGAVILGGKR
jgi:hypothetical protein